MAVRQYKPTSAARRFQSVADFSEITKKAPERSLIAPLNKSGGRNNRGRVTLFQRGGGHKRRYRIIDFRREKMGLPPRLLRLNMIPTAQLVSLSSITKMEKNDTSSPLSDSQLGTPSWPGKTPILNPETRFH